MRSAPAIAFDYVPSRRVALATVVVAFSAVVAPWFANVPMVVSTACSLASIAFATGSLRAFSQPRYRRIAWRAAGWALVDAGGVECAAELVAHVRVGDWLVLDFRDDMRRRFRAPIGTDNLDADTRRRLVLLLARAEVAQGA